MSLPFLLFIAAGADGVVPPPIPGLPTVSDLKAYLRIETDAEDALLGAILYRASAMIELWTDTPIAATLRTAFDPSAADSTPSQFARPLTSLIFPWRPIGPEVSVVDADGVTVDATTYRVDRRTGIIYAKRGVQFSNPPYEITASVGFQHWDNYITSLEFTIGQVMIDVAADLYTRRTPMATSDTGAGTTISWDASRACVERSLASLRMLKLPVAG